MEYPVNQTAFSRATQNTHAWLLNHIVAWFLVFFLPGGGTVLATLLITPTMSIQIVALLGFLGGVAGLLLLYTCVFAWNLFRAPYRQRNETRVRVRTLEEERIPKFTVRPETGRRQYDYENPHLMWAELRVTNTSPTVTLRNVEVQIVTQIDIVDIKEGGRDAPIKHHLYDKGTWSRVSVLWSQLDVSPPSTKIDIPPGATKTALLAFQNNSNGSWTVYNAPTSPKPMSVGGAKIEVEVNSIDSALWKGSYYIECHPNYTDGTLARFEFVEWETYMTNHDMIIPPLIPSKENSQP